MKTCAIVFVACMATVVNGFVPAFGTRGLSTALATVLRSEPEKKDGEGGLDLDLEEMFQMFDAADKEEKFDEAVKKVKGSKDEKSK